MKGRQRLHPVLYLLLDAYRIKVREQHLIPSELLQVFVLSQGHKAFMLVLFIIGTCIYQLETTLCDTQILAIVFPLQNNQVCDDHITYITCLTSTEYWWNGREITTYWYVAMKFPLSFPNFFHPPPSSSSTGKKKILSSLPSQWLIHFVFSFSEEHVSSFYSIKLDHDLCYFLIEAEMHKIFSIYI